jgi:hypothetical protein
MPEAERKSGPRFRRAKAYDSRPINAQCRFWSARARKPLAELPKAKH